MEKLSQRYGDMFTLRIGDSYWLFLNSQRVVSDLLEKRAAIYSSRMNLPMASDLVSGGKRTLILPYGDLWRRERKVMHQILNNKQISTFEPYQDMESRALLYGYLRKPDDWWKAHTAFSSSVIMSVAFGRRAGLDDPNVRAAMGVAAEFVVFLAPGAALVDIFPFLVKIPWFKSLQPWRWYGDDLYRRTTEIYRKEFNGLRKRIQAGTQKPCFMSEFLADKQDKNFTEEEYLYIAGALIEAGSDTTRTTLHQFVAGSALWPDWIVRGREQLDAVCGSNAERLPTMRDMPQLPLIKAAVKESMRWKPNIAETGIPHALTADDEYEGYRIPAGTAVTWNHWAIANNPTEYEQPERFWPERFLNEDLDEPSKGHLGFGTGRRVCVGFNVAYTNLCIAIARLVYCMDIAPVPDKPIDVSRSIKVTDDRAPFAVTITPRSGAHRQLIMRECEGAAL